jgi:hypothetical protein
MVTFTDNKSLNQFAAQGVEKKMILKIVSAIGGDVIDIDVPPQSTVAAVKREIASKKKIPSSTVLLVYRGKQLDDDTMLEDANIGEYDKLYLITRTEGGSR